MRQDLPLHFVAHDQKIDTHVTQAPKGSRALGVWERSSPAPSLSAAIGP